MWKQLHAKFITLSNCSVGQYFSCIVYSVASEEKGGLGGEREEEKGGRRKGDWREKRKGDWGEKGGLGGEREEEKQEHGKGGNLGTVRTSRDSNVIW